MKMLVLLIILLANPINAFSQDLLTIIVNNPINGTYYKVEINISIEKRQTIYSAEIITRSYDSVRNLLNLKPDVSYKVNLNADIVNDLFNYICSENFNQIKNLNGHLILDGTIYYIIIKSSGINENYKIQFYDLEERKMELLWDKIYLILKNTNVEEYIFN